MEPAWLLLTRIMRKYYDRSYGNKNQFNIKLIGVPEEEIKAFVECAEQQRELWPGFEYAGIWWGPVPDVEHDDKDEYCMICVNRIR